MRSDVKNYLDDIKGAIFDLDGVIVDTAKYHYLAWKRLAEELGFDFKESDNEKLKGVSRMKSLEILLETGGLSGKYGEAEQNAFAEKKNAWYVEYISGITENEILKGAREYLVKLRGNGIKTALGTASKNSELILSRLGIKELFDSIIDGNKTKNAKPDPEVFLLAAAELGLEPGRCAVFEDALAGIEAAKNGGMKAIGIGNAANLPNADFLVNGLFELL